MLASGAALFPAFYDARQVASAVEYVCRPDPDLLADGTYFVLEHNGEVVACGGWSRRDKLYTGGGHAGDDRLLDPATEPARVRAMFVREDWTRRGLGRRILDAAEEAAGEGGLHATRAQRDPRRAPALPRLRLRTGGGDQRSARGWRDPSVRDDGEADRVVGFGACAAPSQPAIP